MTAEQEHQEPEWAHTLQEYLVEVEAYKKETPRSQCFTRLLDKLPFVPSEFVKDYNRGMEASLSGEGTGGAISRGEADALFGSVIVEFEKKLPGKADGTKPSAKLAEAQGQLRQYAAMLWGKEYPGSRTRYIGIATDGVRFYAYTPQLKDPLAQTVGTDDVTLTLIEFADWTKFSDDPSLVRDWINRYFLRQDIFRRLPGASSWTSGRTAMRSRRPEMNCWPYGGGFARRANSRWSMTSGKSTC